MYRTASSYTIHNTEDRNARHHKPQATIAYATPHHWPQYEHVLLRTAEKKALPIRVLREALG